MSPRQDPGTENRPQGKLGNLDKPWALLTIWGWVPEMPTWGNQLGNFMGLLSNVSVELNCLKDEVTMFLCAE